MIVTHKHNRRRRKSGYGLVNRIINKLPVELHIPGYNYCGPGTKLETRLKRGDRGINKLDEACKIHDIAYDRNLNVKQRHIADKILIKSALDRYRSSDAKLNEKLAALAVAGAIKTKVKFGMGNKKRNKTLSFAQAVKIGKLALRNGKKRTVKSAVNATLRALKKTKKNIRHPRHRIIPIPKTGGAISLVPIFSALGALGSLGGTAAGVIKTINEAKLARDQLIEKRRHNKALERESIGAGLYITPYKTGCGLDIGAKN